jgi:hypothetical protein
MTGRRALVALIAIVMGVLMAVGAWGTAQTAPTLTDDDYRAIAISRPEIFHPGGPTSGGQISVGRVDRSSDSVTVDVTSDGAKFRVFIDPRTHQVTQVVRQ